MQIDELDWNKIASVAACGEHVIPVAVQNAETNELVMIGYVSRESLDETFRTGRAVFFSTSRRQLHRKGDTSGDVLEVEDVLVNCELTSLLLRVRLVGNGACHLRDDDGTSYTSCFQRALATSAADAG